MRKTLCLIVSMLLVVTIVPLVPASGGHDADVIKAKQWVFTHDCLQGPASPLPQRNGPPGWWDLSEYMLGSITLGIIMLESNGSIDPNTENWTTYQISKVRSEINESFAWWATYYPDAHITFTADFHICNTSYEPIIHPGPTGPYQEYWATEAMADLGYTEGNYWQRTRDYLNDIRASYQTNWAYMVFVVNSANDPDHLFSDNYTAWSYLGGPFIVMTYDNPPYGIENMMQVIRHESCHCFYATDEYNGVTEYSGYLDQPDNEGADCIMYYPGTDKICTQTRLQLGWRDNDSDGIQDIVDTDPETILDTPNITNLTATFTGTAYDVAYPNHNPNGQGNDVTINTITMVHYCVNGGCHPATPTDGTWDEWQENYTFTIAFPGPGSYTIEVQAVNSVGNSDPTPVNITIHVGNNQPPNAPVITGPASGKAKLSYTYSVVTADPDGDQVSYLIDWGDGTTSDWLGPSDSGVSIDVIHNWAKKGTYTIKAKAKDTTGKESDWGTFQVTMPFSSSPAFYHHYPILEFLYRLLMRLPLHR